MKITKRQLSDMIKGMVEESLQEENAGNLGEKLTPAQVKEVMSVAGEDFSPRDIKWGETYGPSRVDWTNFDSRDIRGALKLFNTEDGENVGLLFNDQEGGKTIHKFITPEGKVIVAKTEPSITKKVNAHIADAFGEDTKIMSTDASNAYTTERSTKRRERAKNKPDDDRGLARNTYKAIDKLIEKKVFSSEAKKEAMIKFIAEIMENWDKIYEDFNKNAFAGTSLDLREFESMTEKDDSPWSHDRRVSKRDAVKSRIDKLANKRNKR